MELPGFPPGWFFKEPANSWGKIFLPMDKSSNEGKMDSPFLRDQGHTFLENITTRWRVMDGSFLRLIGYFLMAEAVYVFFKHCPRYLSSHCRSYLNRSLFFFSFSPVFPFRPKLLHPGYPPSKAFSGLFESLFLSARRSLHLHQIPKLNC
jgi:hypothetical protein